METQSQDSLLVFDHCSSALHTGSSSSGATLPINQGENDRQATTTISMLTDDVLLGIFDFCRDDHLFLNPVWDWHFLVHVCRRWRQIMFASPHGLNLKILCTQLTPVRKHLGIWPPFPIVVDYRAFYSYSAQITPNDEDNIVAALDSENLDRVWVVGLSATGSQLEKIAAVMQKPFPVLKYLQIVLEDEDAKVLPAGFLGGSAPSLEKITLSGIPYPALPTLVSSTSGLVELDLHDISPISYIPPEAMAASLAALPRLKKIVIEFGYATTSLPDRIGPPPITQSVLPALASFRFRGPSEYLEGLVARIDGPQLVSITIVYSNPPGDFPATQLVEFIDHSVGVRSTIFRRAHVVVRKRDAIFTLFDHNHQDQSGGWPPSGAIHWQVTHMAQVLSRVSTALSNVVHLELRKGPHFGCMNDVEWRRLLRQFSAVKTLKVGWGLAERMARALEDTAEETEEKIVGPFPFLELICLQDEPEASISIDKFVALRQLSGHPVTAVFSEREFDERLESYIE